MPSDENFRARVSIGPFGYSEAAALETGTKRGLSVTCRRCIHLACYITPPDQYHFYCAKDPERNRILNVSCCMDFRFRRSGLDFQEGER